MPTPVYPEATKCPKCGYAEATTVCRFCGHDKLGPRQNVSFSVTHTSTGMKCVRFSSMWKGQEIQAAATLVPADPEVGFTDPYPLYMIVADKAGNRLHLERSEERELLRPLIEVLF
jgi:hypothetical protein